MQACMHKQAVIYKAEHYCPYHVPSQVCCVVQAAQDPLPFPGTVWEVNDADPSSIKPAQQQQTTRVAGAAAAAAASNKRWSH